MVTVKKIKYIGYVASSIDGRIAKNKHSLVDWTSKEDWNFFQEALSQADAVVVGRNTYKTAENRLKKRNTIVFTSKVDKPKVQGSIVFFNPNKSNLKKFLQNKNYKKVAIIGGPKVYNFFLKHNILDELFVTIEPYVFTTGIPMFSSNIFKKYKFILQTIKKLNKKSTLLLKYKNAN
jgi:dihydrofolate reductase